MDITNINNQISFIKDSYREQGPRYKDTIYYGINEDGTVTMSTINPFSLINAKYIVAFVNYNYTRVTAQDSSYLVLFAKEEIVDNKITIDGWTLSFDKPIFTINYTDNRRIIVQKDNLKVELVEQKWFVRDNFHMFWNFFDAARHCSTNGELELLKKLYDKDKTLAKLTIDNLKQQAKIEMLNETIEAHKGLLNKIEQLVDKVDN